MKSVCVFCGASNDVADSYLESARQLGTELARAGIRLVYGGASVGLMGAAADAALAAGGEVVGIIPRSLVERELEHNGLTELIECESLAQRKEIMADRSDAFVCLPGGAGTLDEFFEVFTWYQLGFHQKPVGLIDLDGFWQPLLALLDHQVAKGFVLQSDRDSVLVTPTAESMVARLQSA